uniref:Uncharacterized protein n=1 Tax=Oryza meridionalis TaxID=40149 RepID=A0A0E0DQV0_9ORYZ
MAAEIPRLALGGGRGGRGGSDYRCHRWLQRRRIRRQPRAQGSAWWSMSLRKGQKEKDRRKTERREKKMRETRTFYMDSLSSIGLIMYFNASSVLGQIHVSVMSTSKDHTF